MLLMDCIRTEARTEESYIILMSSQLGTLTCCLGLLQYSFPFTPCLIDALVATESERDLSIREESPGHLLAAQGKSIHDRTPTTTKMNAVAHQLSVISYLNVRRKCLLLTENTLSTHGDGLDDVAPRPDTRVKQDSEVAFFLGAAHPR